MPKSDDVCALFQILHRRRKGKLNLLRKDRGRERNEETTCRYNHNMKSCHKNENYDHTLDYECPKWMKAQRKSRDK